MNLPFFTLGGGFRLLPTIAGTHVLFLVSFMGNKQTQLVSQSGFWSRVFKWNMNSRTFYLNWTPPLSQHLCTLEFLSRYIICSAPLKLIRMALHHSYIQCLCGLSHTRGCIFRVHMCYGPKTQNCHNVYVYTFPMQPHKIPHILILLICNKLIFVYGNQTT